MMSWWDCIFRLGVGDFIVLFWKGWVCGWLGKIVCCWGVLGWIFGIFDIDYVLWMDVFIYIVYVCRK